MWHMIAIHVAHDFHVFNYFAETYNHITQYP